MAKAWYYAKNNTQLGPATEQALRQMLQSGELRPNDLVWADGMAEWAPASTVEALRGGPTATPVSATPLGYRGPVAPTGAPPKTWLAESILVTLCCCLPFGIVGIVYASQVNGKFQRGDINGAEASSANAKKWVTWGFACGLIAGAIRGFLEFSKHR